MASCTCGILDNASKEPDHVIRWDERDQMFYIAFGKTGRMMVYFCPFCGGKVPDEQRKSLFAHISEQEHRRLVALISGLKTAEAIIARFGPPDERKEIGTEITTPEKDGKPSVTRTYSSLYYRGLSDVADFTFDIGVDGQVQCSFSPKRLSKEN